MNISAYTNKKTSLFWKYAEYSLIFYLAVFPFINFQSFLYGGTATRAISLILLASILGVFLGFWILQQKIQLSFPKNIILNSLLVYFIFVIVSGFAGLGFATSFWSVATRMTGIWYFLNLGLIMFVFWGVSINRDRQNKMILTIIASTALYSLLSFCGPEGLGFFFKNYTSDGFTFGNSTFAGMYIFAAFLLSLYYLCQSINKKWWMYAIPVTLVVNPYIISRQIWLGDFSNGFIGEARSSTYAVLISLGALFLIWLISKIKDSIIKKRVAYSVLTVFLCVVAICAFSLLSPNGFLRKVYLSQSTAARPLVWEMSEKAIKQRPLLGFGADNFERVFEKNYDNRLLQDEYGKEAWFDRAHNIFIDQAVDNGILGLILYILVYVIVIFSLLYSALNSSDKADRLFASILIVYFSLHFLELQTAFDTTVSYPILAFMFVAAIIISGRTIASVKGRDQQFIVNSKIKYLISGVLIVFFSWSLFFGWFPILNAEITNGYIRRVGSPEKRIPSYKTLFGSPMDTHSFLWRTVTDFQRGIAENPDILKDPQKVKLLKNELSIFEDNYKTYIKNNPNNFRARLGLADVLIYQRLFEEDKLKEAQEVLDAASILVPQSPQPYWMKAVGYIYMKKFDLARQYAKTGLVLNPQIKESQKVVSYVEKSIKDFPDIDLYFFTQI